jgi:hypothetical protein
MMFVCILNSVETSKNILKLSNILQWIAIPDNLQPLVMVMMVMMMMMMVTTPMGSKETGKGSLLVPTPAQTVH